MTTNRIIDDHERRVMKRLKLMQRLPPDDISRIYSESNEKHMEALETAYETIITLFDCEELTKRAEEKDCEPHRCKNDLFKIISFLKYELMNP